MKFGRWLRGSNEEHRVSATEVEINLDTGPGAAQAALEQLDSKTLCDRGVIIGGNPESCIRGGQDVPGHWCRPADDANAD